MIISRNIMKAVLAGLILAVAAFILASCTDQPKADDCGYTWFDKQKPADTIFIHEVETWEQFPTALDGSPGCRVPGNIACYTPTVMPNGSIIASIHLHKTHQIRGGACSSRLHELRHANGEGHVEDHLYTPRDFTR